ncbi:MAG: tetratricopeptide repeat protein [Usitatibacter sp.]
MSELAARALAALQSGRAAEAEALVRAAPAAARDASALQILGAACSAQGRHDAALEAFERAVQLLPASAALQYNRASCLQRCERIEEALQGYRKALQLDPALAPARSALVSALCSIGLESFRAKAHERALASYREALALDPATDAAANALGAVLVAMDRLDEAIETLRAVCARSPGDADAINNLGCALQARGEAGPASDAFRRALALRPAHADALSNLGFLEQEEGRDDEAAALYRRALAADPQSASAACNLGVLQLCAFEFGEGWELNEARYRTAPPVATARELGLPRFTAEDWGRGERIALWGEQGVGDRIVYSTLLPELESRGERFVLETDARLATAYRRAHPGWEVVTREESAAAFAQCSRQLALASLPRLMRPTLQSFARQPPAVLAADAARAAGLRERLAAPGRKLVGISWRSFQKSARGALQRKKSAPLDAFLALARDPALRLVDLQYGDTASERADFAARGGHLARLDGLDLFHDLDGVLAAIEACDLVITTSNVTAHLAGALGKTTLLVYLAARPPFHYWATDASGRSLWYPSMRIVTGREIDSWAEALARAGELAA